VDLGKPRSFWYQFCDAHFGFQISRALTVRNHQLTAHFTARVFEAFSDETISWNAAKAIGEIAAVDSILTKRNHAVIKVSLLAFTIPDLSTLRDRFCMHKNM
jgi:RNAPII transcription regulator C-terminal